MKKIFSKAGILTLLLFSFYYTDFAASVIKNNDPIMKELKAVLAKKETEYVNAKLTDNSIIPGISGISVDLNSSYSAMKRYGFFDDSLMVFDEVKPSVSVDDIYDKYITSGNESKENISLIFIIDNCSYVEDIINILDSKSIRATFFISYEVINNSKDLVELINNSKHEIELYSREYTAKEIKRANKVIKKIVNKDLNFCYIKEDSSIILDNCSKLKMHTIIPSIITRNFPYTDIKRNVRNGSIIKLDNTEEVLRELKYILNYINQKGYNAVTLIDLIKE